MLRPSGGPVFPLFASALTTVATFTRATLLAGAAIAILTTSVRSVPD
jgi:hypothetical protein